MSGLVLQSVRATHRSSADAPDSILELKREYSLSRDHQPLTVEMSVSETSPETDTGCLDGYCTLKGGGRPPITRKLPKLEAFAPLMRQKKRQQTGLNRSSQAYQPHEQVSGRLDTYKAV